MSDSENTFRALKGEPLLSTKFGCRIGWHVWEKYSEPKQIIEGAYKTTFQTRRCGYCNIHKVNVLRKEYN